MRIIQNPDKEYANEIKQRLKANNGFCPCSLSKNENTKCKCKAFRDQVKNGIAGACHCGLWIAEDDAE